MDLLEVPLPPRERRFADTSLAREVGLGSAWLNDRHWLEADHFQNRFLVVKAVSSCSSMAVRLRHFLWA